MQSIYDYKKFGILYVDDEEKSLKYFTRAFGDQFRIFTAPNAEEGFKVFDQHKDEIAVLMTDQRMPGEKGVQLLERVRQLRPRVIRILATAYSDIEAAISAVNTGAIYKYIHKPWDVPQLEITLKRALEFFLVQVERDQLVKQKLSVLQNIIITDRVISLGVMGAGFGQQVRNPLQAVQAYLELIPGRLRDENVSLEALRNPNYWQDLYREVQRQVARIGTTLAEVMHGADARSVPFNDQVLLDEVVRVSIEKAQTELGNRGVRVQTNIPATLAPLTVDGPKFQKLIEFLLRAKSAALSSGGSVSIEARPAQDGVEVEVKNGRAIPENGLKSLFNPFLLNRDSTQEYGINLLACFFLVYHHGGTVTAQNESSGAILKVYLPAKPRELDPTQDVAFVSGVLANDDLWERLLSTE